MMGACWRGPEGSESAGDLEVGDCNLPLGDGISPWEIAISVDQRDRGTLVATESLSLLLRTEAAE